MGPPPLAFHLAVSGEYRQAGSYENTSQVPQVLDEVKIENFKSGWVECSLRNLTKLP
jgi:hypothetical protein